MDKALRIYERRLGRIVGAACSLGAVGLTGLVAALRHRHAIDLDYGTITALFAASMTVGPMGGLAGRGLARRRLRARMRAEVESHPRVPAPIMRRFVAARSAAGLESLGVSLPLANRAVLGVVGWLWVLGAFSTSGVDVVGKAFGFVVSNGALSVAALAAALFFAGRRMARREASTSALRGLTKIVVLGATFAAGLESIFRADEQAVAAVAYFGVGGIAVLLPSLWKTAARLRVERASLAAQPLLPPSGDVEEENRRLIETVGWADGPPEVRAEALRSLLPRLPPTERAPHLEEGLSSGAALLRLASLQLAHELRHTPALSRLLALTHDRATTEDEAALLPALLHRHRDPEVRSALLHLLAHPSIPVREAAAVSLGLVGDASCVAALREAGRAGGGMQEVSTEAIERIQIRLSQTPGQLSLAEGPESGALSETQAPGSLSFPR